MSIDIRRVVCGLIQENCYIVQDEGRDDCVPEGGQSAVLIPPVILTDVGGSCFPGQGRRVDPDMAVVPEGKVYRHFQGTDGPLVIGDKNAGFSVPGFIPADLQPGDEETDQWNGNAVKVLSHKFLQGHDFINMEPFGLRKGIIPGMDGGFNPERENFTLTVSQAGYTINLSDIRSVFVEEETGR